MKWPNHPPAVALPVHSEDRHMEQTAMDWQGRLQAVGHPQLATATQGHIGASRGWQSFKERKGKTDGPRPGPWSSFLLREISCF